MVARPFALVVALGCASCSTPIVGADAASDTGRRCATGSTLGCAGVVGDDTFADFRAGDLGRSVARLYVQARGTLETVHRNDLDGDGFIDAVVPSFRSTTSLLDSFVYWGSGAGVGPTSPRSPLPTSGADDAVAADLDADGRPDIVFANQRDDTTTHVDSVVYWGGDARSYDARTPLPTVGAQGVEVADIDADGWLDVVLADVFDDGAVLVGDSLVYLGSATGFDAARRIVLPVLGAVAVCVADLDADGNADLLLPAEQATRIFFGPGLTRTQDLPGVGAYGCSIADLDQDGDLDAVITHRYDFLAGSGGPSLTESRIYHGGPGGLIASDYEALPSIWAGEPTVGDFDGNGWLDIVVPHTRDDPGPSASYETSSHLYYRTDGGAALRDQTFETRGTYDVVARDWNADGHLDLLFGSLQDDAGDVEVGSRLFLGSPVGPTGAFLVIPSVGPLGLVSSDAGNTWDRSDVEHFESRALDLGSPRDLAWLEIVAEVPRTTALRVRPRSEYGFAPLPTRPGSRRHHGSAPMERRRRRTALARHRSRPRTGLRGTCSTVSSSRCRAQSTRRSSTA